MFVYGRFFWILSLVLLLKTATAAEPAHQPRFPVTPSLTAVELQAAHQKGTMRVRDPWGSRDKLDHFFGSAVVAGSCTLALRVMHNADSDALAISVGATVAAGLIKELYDLHHPGHQASLKDLTMDISGAILGALICLTL